MMCVTLWPGLIISLCNQYSFLTNTFKYSPNILDGLKVMQELWSWFCRKCWQLIPTFFRVMNKQRPRNIVRVYTCNLIQCIYKFSCDWEFWSQKQFLVGLQYQCGPNESNALCMLHYISNSPNFTYCNPALVPYNFSFVYGSSKTHRQPIISLIIIYVQMSPYILFGFTLIFDIIVSWLYPLLI